MGWLNDKIEQNKFFIEKYGLPGWVDMIPMMMGSHRHTVHSTMNIEPSAILLGRKPTLSTDMLP